MAVPSDGAALRRVTLRAPVRDPLLARQRLERTLASLDWAPPGLPRRALLLLHHTQPSSLSSSRPSLRLAAAVVPTWRRHSKRSQFVPADSPSL